MNIAIFGGTFDPIHTGHLRAATAAARKFRLSQILFIPTGNPPHKPNHHLTPFHHRYAMVALACAQDRRFVPSLLEAPTPDGRPHYSINTARAVKGSLRPHDRLFFLVGADAFLDLPHWRAFRSLLELVDFIVVSRPGFDVAEISHHVLPGVVQPRRGKSPPDTIRLRHTRLHILRGVNAPLASRDIREAVLSGKRATGLVPPLVEEYILKEGLYRPAPAGQQ